MIPFSPTDNVIEIGGGEAPVFRPNVDIRPGPTVDIVADLNDTFPIPDSIYDGIYSSYIIEHISWRKIRGFISELHRILKPGGRAFIVTANLKEQCRVMVEKDEWVDEDICRVFGDQNYKGDQWVSNAHFTGFSPNHAVKLFNEAGFSTVFTVPHPNCNTDMIIEAVKDKTTKPVEYEQVYFDRGGYYPDGYWDFPNNWTIARRVAELNPESVLEIGCARGYVLKRLEDVGLKVKGLDISKHCYHTRAIKDIITWDITKAPWPVGDKEFDLGFSHDVLDGLTAEQVDVVSAELDRTCRRSFHIVQDEGAFDSTEGCTFGPLNDHRPLNVPMGIGDNQVKLNIGSFTTMFHHNWLNIDTCNCQTWADRHNFRFLRHDVTYPLPHRNQSVDLIYTSHCLEHLSYAQGQAFLSDCYRVMKPDAVMRIIVPNTATLIDSLAFPDIVDDIGQFDTLNAGAAAAPTGMAKLWNLVCSNHNALYDAETLSHMLKTAGFRTIERQVFRESLSKQILIETVDMLPTISLFMDVKK